MMVCVSRHHVRLGNTEILMMNAKIVSLAIIAVGVSIKSHARVGLIQFLDRGYAHLVRMGILRQMWRRHILLAKICRIYV